MLSDKDIEWIKQNRSDITQNRTITIKGATQVQTGKHPITGEPIRTTSEEYFTVIWNEVKALRSGEKMIMQGIEVQQEDVNVTFDIDVDLDAIDYLEHQGARWRIVSSDRVGIGEDNRQEAVVRKVT